MSRRAGLQVIAVAVLAAGVAVAAIVLVQQRGAASRDARARLVAEVVSDHLRVLAAARPAELESGDAHEVKPWLAARLEFAPAVPVAEGSELRLRGAAVGYVFDRKAAVLLYRLRLHQVTLLACRAGGLGWPTSGGAAAAPPLAQASERGFRAVLWRTGEVGWALVSDSGPEELAQLAGQLAAGAAGQGAR